jgi:hypothetical protein
MGNHPDKIENDFYQVPSEEINFLRMHTIFQKKEIKQFYKDFHTWSDLSIHICNIGSVYVFIDPYMQYSIRTCIYRAIYVIFDPYMYLSIHICNIRSVHEIADQVNEREVDSYIPIRINSSWSIYREYSWIDKSLHVLVNYYITQIVVRMSIQLFVSYNLIITSYDTTEEGVLHYLLITN